MVGLVERAIEYHDDGIANVLHQKPTVGLYNGGHLLVEAIEDSQKLLWIDAFRERRKFGSLSKRKLGEIGGN